MRLICIRKKAGLLDDKGTAHPPFRFVECADGHAHRILIRTPFIRTEDDYRKLLDDAPEKTVRQMARNAGLSCEGGRDALKARLLAFAEGEELEVVPVKKDDSGEAGPSEDEPLPAGAELDRQQFREELQGKTVKDLREMCDELELTKYGLSKDELIDQLVDAVAGAVAEEVGDEG